MLIVWSSSSGCPQKTIGERTGNQSVHSTGLATLSRKKQLCIVGGYHCSCQKYFGGTVLLCDYQDFESSELCPAALTVTRHLHKTQEAERTPLCMQSGSSDALRWALRVWDSSSRLISPVGSTQHICIRYVRALEWVNSIPNHSGYLISRSFQYLFNTGCRNKVYIVASIVSRLV